MGRILSLVKKEYALLEFFMRHPNQTFSLEMLQNHVSPSDSAITSEGVRTTVNRLRKKLAVDGAKPSIETDYGFGYRLAT